MPYRGRQIGTIGYVYEAEHAHLGTRCGTGWTRGRAYRDLARHLNSDPRHLT